MNSTSLQRGLADTLLYLMSLSRDEVRPEAAKERLRFLQKQHPDVGMDLLWQEEPYDQSLHYDVLLRLPEGGRLLLSFSPDRALPWPMRGVQRWSEMDLVRVNNTVLKVDQAMACLDFIWDEAPVISRLVNVCLIQEALDKDPIRLSDAELQAAMDGFRRAHKLLKAEDTYRWLEEHGMTHEQYERHAADEAVAAKLRDRVTAGRVEDYFERHRADFDAVRIARVEFTDEAIASQTCEQIRAGGVGFYEAAERHFVAGPASGVVFAALRRGQMPPELGAAVFAAAPDDVLGPLRTEDGYAIVRVLSFEPASLDEPTRHAIKNLLFEEWLGARRREAAVEWFWGNAGRTSQVA